MVQSNVGDPPNTDFISSVDSFFMLSLPSLLYGLMSNDHRHSLRANELLALAYLVSGLDGNRNAH
jgi:hypothetical protein